MFTFFIISIIFMILFLIFVLLKLYYYKGDTEKFLKDPINWVVSFNQDDIGRVIELKENIATIKTVTGEIKKDISQIVILYKIER